MITGPDALTPSEARIVRMAADGMGNRDIAQALFLTVRTVENHLGSAYRKLGIGSRDELRRAVGDRLPAIKPEWLSLRRHTTFVCKSRLPTVGQLPRLRQPDAGANRGRTIASGATSAS